MLLQFATEFNLNDSEEHWSACFQSRWAEQVINTVFPLQLALFTGFTRLIQYPLSLSLSLSHSDPHSVTSLLVQQLLSQFSTAFLVNNGSSATTTADVSINSSTGGGGGREASSPHHSLKEFLCQDTPLLLMLAIQLVGQKVFHKSRNFPS